MLCRKFNKNLLWLSLLAGLLALSCDSKTIPEIKSSGPQSLADTTAPVDKLPLLDTTISLSHIPPSGYHGADLTDSLAMAVLYRHYKKKGYLTADNLPESAILSGKEGLSVVAYDTIIITDFNNNGYPDAVITFWVTPPYASGHCWQPHRAIIADTDDGYKISNEEFIPENFCIDSIKQVNGKQVIFGYDYDCGGHKELRQLRITLAH